MSKPKIVKDYERLDIAIQEQIKLSYPYGFDKHLVTFKNIQGKFVSALPFETDDRYYLVRMSRLQAQEIIREDDDYDDDGVLKKEVKLEFEEKYDDGDAPEEEGIEIDDFPDEDEEDDD